MVALDSNSPTHASLSISLLSDDHIQQRPTLNMIKTAFMTLAMLLPPTLPVKPAQPEVGRPLPAIQIIKPLPAPAVKNLAELPLAPAPFDPIGTHPNDYPPGQCTYGVASMKGDIPDWGNANNWASAARAAGYTVSATPILGAVAQTGRGSYGHVAVVTAITADGPMITEMNYDYNGGVRTRLAAPGEFVYIYI